MKLYKDKNIKESLLGDKYQSSKSQNDFYINKNGYSSDHNSDPS